MSDELAMLRAVNATPGDDTPRLALADYYDERGQEGDAFSACGQRLAVALRAVLAAPEDDAPRLEYAAIAERYGRVERAEFIRVQCELASGAHVPAGSLWPRSIGPGHLHDRIRELLGPHEEGSYGRNSWEWFAQHMTWAQNHIVARGFIAEVTCTAADWLQYADAITAQHPVTTVRLTTGLDWHGDARDRVTLRETIHGRIIDAPVYVCKNIKYGQWWGAVGTVMQHILAAEWPRIAFELPPAIQVIEPGQLEYVGAAPPIQDADGTLNVSHEFRLGPAPRRRGRRR